MRTSKLSVGLITTLLTLTGMAAISLPSAAQDPGDCIPSGFPVPLSPECQAFLDTLVPVLCEDPEIGIEPDCQPAPETPDCTPPTPSETFVDDLDAFVACVEAVAPDADSEICTALGQPEGTDAAICINTAVTEAVCGLEGATGTTAAECLGSLVDVDGEVCDGLGAEGASADECIVNAISGALAALGPSVQLDPIGAVFGGDDIELTGTFAAGELLVAPLPLPVTVTISLDGTDLGTATTDDEDGTFSFTFDGSGTSHGDELEFVATATYDPVPAALFEATSAQSVEVQNAAPAASAGSDATVDEGSTVNLDGAGSSDGDGDSLTFAWVQTGGPDVTLSDDGTDAPSFTAPLVDGPAVLTFEVTVDDGFGGTDSDEVSITVVDLDEDATEATIQVGDSAVVISAATDAFSPQAGTSSSNTYQFRVLDNNGADTIDDELVDAVLTGPNGPFALTVGTVTEARVVPEGTPGSGNNVKIFPFDVDVPARIQDGAYAFHPTFNGGALANDPGFTIDNVAPTIDGTLIDFVGRAGGSGSTSGASSFTVDDLNWGTYDGSDSSELSGITFEILDENQDPATGFTILADLGSGFEDVTSGIDLSGETGGIALVIPIKVSFDNTVALGEVVPTFYTVSATVTDLGLTPLDDSIQIADIEVLPANFGFSIEVDDGNDGLSFADAEPGETTSNAADPLKVTITGTVPAASLDLAIGTFQAGPDSFSPSDAIIVVQIYEALEDIGFEDPLEFSYSGTGVSIPLDALGASLSDFYVVLEVTLPVPQHEGSYTSTIDVVGHGVEQLA